MIALGPLAAVDPVQRDLQDDVVELDRFRRLRRGAGCLGDLLLDQPTELRVGRVRGKQQRNQQG
jgi:hypothetical protein